MPSGCANRVMLKALRTAASMIFFMRFVFGFLEVRRTSSGVVTGKVLLFNLFL